jgi:hypothetical protein
MKEIRVHPVLQLFAIIDPSIEPKSESTDEVKKQILYYYPYHSVEQQVKTVGLLLGLTQFTNSFQSQIEIIKTSKTKTIIRKSKDRLFVLKLRLGVDLIETGGKKYANYQDIKDSILKEFMESIFERIELLSQPLDDLSVLDYLKLELSMLTTLPGVIFSPFDDKTHRKIISVVSKLQTKIPQFETCLFYKNSLSWTSFEDFNDILALYRYITDSASGKFYDGFINQVKPKGQSIVSQRLFSTATNSSSHSFTGFLIGPTPQELKNATEIKPKCISLSNHKRWLIVYQYQDLLTLCMVSHEKSTFLTQPVWYQYLQNTILDLFRDVEIQETKPLTSYNYVTFNRMTLRLKYWCDSNPNYFDFVHDECQRYLVD